MKIVNKGKFFLNMLTVGMLVSVTGLADISEPTHKLICQQGEGSDGASLSVVYARHWILSAELKVVTHGKVVTVTGENCSSWQGQDHPGFGDDDSIILCSWGSRMNSRDLSTEEVRTLSQLKGPITSLHVVAHVVNRPMNPAPRPKYVPANMNLDVNFDPSQDCRQEDFPGFNNS